MNSLSWMIYLAGAVDSINFALSFVFIGSLICVGVGTFAWTIVAVDREDTSGFKKFVRNSAITALVATVVTIPIPSKSTIYAIAASEMGENILKTPTATKAMKALDAWLDRQIAGEKSAQAGK